MKQPCRSVLSPGLFQRLRRMPERRQHVLAIEIDHSRLIRLAGVDVYDTDSAVEQLVHLFDVDRGFGADSPGLQDLVHRGFGDRFLLDFDRARNVIQTLERFWSEAPKLSGLFCGLLIADDNILLNQDGHVGGVLAGGTRAVFPFRFVLHPG